MQTKKSPARRTVSEEGLERIRTGNHARFIAAARAKHGDRYDYSRVEYLTQKTPVAIICPRHGPFVQTPNRHLQGRTGCPRCGVEQRGAKKQSSAEARFLREFHLKFGDHLEIVSPYRGARQGIALRCRKHGSEFTSKPTSLLSNGNQYGCPSCAKEAGAAARRVSVAEFEGRVAARFGEAITVESKDFDSLDSEVSARCAEHGPFKASARTLLYYSAYGCPKCSAARQGWAGERIARIERGEVDGTRPTRIALMRIEVFGIEAYKLGTTVSRLETRYADAVKAVLFEATLPESDALKLEMSLHLQFADMRDHRIMSTGIRKKKRWPGDTEIYGADAVDPLLSEIRERIRELEQRTPGYWHRMPELSQPRFAERQVDRPKGVWNAAKAVIDVDSLEVFDSATAAAHAIGTSQGNVSAVCNGTRTSARGRRFLYLMDYETGLRPRQNRNKGRGATRAKSVICLDDGKIFGTITEAARAYGVSNSHIVSVCRGHRGQAGGRKFAYLSDHESGQTPKFEQRRSGGAHYRARPVICLDTGERWDTGSLAAQAMGLSPGAITAACKGRNKTAGGKRWAYADET